MEHLKITKKILIKGDFHGKYHGDEVLSDAGPNISDYKIDFVEGEISNAIKCDYIEYISNDSLSLELDKLDNVKIRLDDPSIKKNEAVFIEDLVDIIIYDIEFSEVLHEVDGAFGKIKGKIYGSICYEEEVILAKEPPKKTSEIVKEKAKIAKDKVKYGAYPLLSNLFYIFLFICLAAVFKENLIYLLLFSAGIYLFRTIVAYLIELLFRSSYAVFILLILFGLFSFFTNGFELTESDEEETEIVETDPPEYDELVSRKINWKDYNNKTYSGVFNFKYGNYIKSKNNKEKIAATTSTTLYGNIVEYHKSRLDFVYKVLDSIKNRNKLNRLDFANVIVSMTQHIPYSLNIEGNCKNLSGLPPSYIELINEGHSCISYNKYDILTPIEFFYNKAGDCDTRTVQLYTILKKYGYDVVILNSDLYTHSMLGVNLPVRGKYKLLDRKKYFFWETTNIGWKRGELPPENSDISKWYVVLK